MKRIIIFLAAILTFSSCGSMLQTRDLQKQVLFVDYRPYIDAGLHLSPNDYPKPHTPVGELNLIIDPEIIAIDDWSVSEKSLGAKELLKMAVDEAIIRGANGISNLKIEVVSQPYQYYRRESLLGTTFLTKNVDRYVIRGVLIRVAEDEE